MIPFASQRGLGQDLATHLMNEEDNEYMEVAQVRGAIARDLHGAFAEWEAQAHGLTKCRNYLYSLSINPDQRQRRLTREEYLAYIDAVEERLGLTGQPRAVVFHIKQDKDGNSREHCHVVWSRIDAREGKAVHMPFDHEKLMMVTRQFADEHGLRLPDGYYKDVERKGRQVTLYEQSQQTLTGLTLEERKAIITQAWRQSDSARAFVHALEEQGYMLATGKRPYVLVDLYGQVNALPKLIDDPQVRTKDIRAFLEKEFPPESLPSVEEAKAFAAEHRKASQDFFKASARAQELERLKERQAERRRLIETDIARAKDRQAGERRELSEHHRRERSEARAAYLAQVRRIRQERDQRQPRGVTAFMSRITGITLLRKTMQHYRDRKLYETFIEGRLDLHARQDGERRTLQHRHHLQDLDLERRQRGLDRVEARERQSLDKSLTREQRTKQRGRHEHMPAFRLELKPRGRPAAPHKAMKRFTSPLREQAKKAAAEQTQPRKRLELTEEFDRFAGEGRSGEGTGSAAGDFKPVAQDKVRRKGASKRKEEFNRAAGETGTGEATGTASGDFNPVADEKARQQSEASPRKDEFNHVAETGQSEGTVTGDAFNEKPVSDEKTRRRRRRKRRHDRKDESEIRPMDDRQAAADGRNEPARSPSTEGQQAESEKGRQRARRSRKRKRDRDREM